MAILKKMSLILVLLAAGDSKRLESNTPKPFHIVNNKTLLDIHLMRLDILMK